MLSLEKMKAVDHTESVKVYLDNCCFNRPFDDQSLLVVRLETESKLHVQELIRQGTLKLCWSFVLDYENGANPFHLRKYATGLRTGKSSHRLTVT